MATPDEHDGTGGSATHDADPIEQGTPAGKVADLIDEADELGATTGGDPPDVAQERAGDAEPPTG